MRMRQRLSREPLCLGVLSSVSADERGGLPPERLCEPGIVVELPPPSGALFRLLVASG